MNFLEITSAVFSNVSLRGAVFSTVMIIMLGYYVRKKNLVPENGAKVLSSVLLSVALPALAFKAFLSDINAKTFTSGRNIFIFGFIAYIILILLGKLIYKGLPKEKSDTMTVLTAFGSTTFYGIPIITAFFMKENPEAVIYANLFNIAYRVFLYSYALMTMSDQKFDPKHLKTIFLNPIVLATFVGMILWFFQKSLPQTVVANPLYTVGSDLPAKLTVSIFRFDLTLPWFVTALGFLASLSSPLAWLAIGMTLASISMKEAIKDKFVWVYTAIKLILVPAIFLAIMIAINSFFPLGYYAIVGVMIMLATPPATVAVSYAIRFEKEEVLASNASLVTSVLSVIAIIFWVVVLTALHTSGVIL
ncbi:AEC family transporter [Streptococcus catagoni]|uniref:AEC family transporter n=1 Tax=Streptococcus catagoni TaxID=2654874 RepID=UPI00140E391D|nr:AEC family transporter [Streptococcus catagoni]